MQTEKNQARESEPAPRNGNIWGWKWSFISLLIILFFISIAVCRYVMIKPERLIIPEQVEDL